MIFDDFKDYLEEKIRETDNKLPYDILRKECIKVCEETIKELGFEKYLKVEEYQKSLFEANSLERQQYFGFRICIKGIEDITPEKRVYYLNNQIPTKMPIYDAYMEYKNITLYTSNELYRAEKQCYKVSDMEMPEAFNQVWNAYINSTIKDYSRKITLLESLIKNKDFTKDDPLIDKLIEADEELEL